MKGEFNFSALVIRLGNEFKKRGMFDHVKSLREFYGRLAAAQKAWLKKPDPRPWSFDFVLGWMFVLRVPPFDKIYPVLPHNTSCPKCGSGPKPGSTTPHLVRIKFPGGALIWCSKCETRWLQEDSLLERRQRAGLPH